jgi:CheY-like chemotaxis protein/anti-sigma regulatory factor (Ser/Thr protein kinase)
MANRVDPLDRLESAAIAEEAMSATRHDVRNKLGSIRNAAFYLRKRTEATPLWQSDPRMAQLFTLIDETLADASHLLEGPGRALEEVLPRRVERVEGAACVERAIESARLPAADVTIDLDLGPGALHADASEVALAARCLIENAAEAAPEGSVVSVGASAASDGRFEIRVRDEGPGLPGGTEHVFQAFRTTREGHLGLGLAIARRAVRRNDGTLTFRSSPRGVCAVLSFPLCEPVARAPGGAARLLIIEDDESNRITLSVLLEDEGFLVDAAASITLTKQHLAAPGADWDVVLVDQHLGDGMGSEIVPLLRERLPAAKVVQLSGSLAEDDRTAILFDASLPKGTSFPDLLFAIRRLLEREAT